MCLAVISQVVSSTSLSAFDCGRTVTAPAIKSIFSCVFCVFFMESVNVTVKKVDKNYNSYSIISEKNW